MNSSTRTRLAAFALIAVTLAAPAQSAEWPVKPGDFTVRNFSFGSFKFLRHVNRDK